MGGDTDLMDRFGKIPGVMFRLGAVDPVKLVCAKEMEVPLPGLHSPLFAPVYAPTIATGAIPMATMALDLLK